MALGGHNSKAHPNQSIKYKLKLEKYKANEVSRALLRAAQDLMLQQNPDCDLNMSRSKVARIKKNLQREVDKFKDVTDN